MLKNIELERANYAWECIEEIKRENEQLQKNYGSYVRRAPTLIQANGLPNTLAFYHNRAKRGEKAYELLYQHISNWAPLKKLTKGKDPLQWIIKDASSQDVFRASREIIALLYWMKRFAEAELKGEEE